jgi:hypothetical protein
MRIRTSIAALALAGAGTATALTAAPAVAEEGGSDTRPCVTRNEFEAVSDGYSKERIFDSDGNLYGTVTEGGQVVQKAYAWNPCTDAAEADDYVSVEFKKDCANCALRVFAKHWYVD